MGNVKRGKAVVAALAGALVLLLAAGAGYLRFGHAAAVPVVEAARATMAQRVVGPGTVQARVPVTLSARITATVREVSGDVGDAVRLGQELAVLDDRDLAARRGMVGGQQVALARNLEAARATVARAQADLDLARSRQQRDAELLRTGFVSPAALDASNAALRAAAANLDNARAALLARDGDVQALSQEARYADTMLTFTRIAAPMDGVIVSRQAEAGATVVPGSPLFHLVDPATLWVATRVDESVVGRVQVGQAASIRLRTGETLSGKVARIARQSDAATRELEVGVAFDVPPARFAIDQEAEVSIVVGDASGIVVPQAALTRDREGRPGVLVVVGSRTEFRPVRTGASDARLVLIAQGLAGGERVVSPAGSARAGMRVRALDAASL
jgi:RND family efflux transporter MFP subunit